MPETPPRNDNSPGFALIEVIIACALLATAAIGVAQIMAMSIRAGLDARTRTTATVLASQKMEQLRSLTWSLADVDLSTDLSTDPATDAGSGLTPTPAGTLDANAPPYVDYLDGAGQWIGNGTSPPAASVYIRRWSIAPLADDPDHSLVLQVIVTTSREPRDASRAGVRMADESRLVMVRTRTAS